MLPEILKNMNYASVVITGYGHLKTYVVETLVKVVCSSLQRSGRHKDEEFRE